MFVLSIEGPAYVDRGLWCTHKILGVFQTRDEALAEIQNDADEEDIVILTDMTTKDAERIEPTFDNNAAR